MATTFDSRARGHDDWGSAWYEGEYLMKIWADSARAKWHKLNMEGARHDDPERVFTVSKDDLRKAHDAGFTHIFGLKLVNRSGL